MDAHKAVHNAQAICLNHVRGDGQNKAGLRDQCMTVCVDERCQSVEPAFTAATAKVCLLEGNIF